MNLKKIGIENFRIFNDPVEFEFKPITILIGQNNAGKSTLLKLINLLVENCKNQEDFYTFPNRLNVGLHQIGIGFLPQVFSLNSKSDELVISLEFEGLSQDRYLHFFTSILNLSIKLHYKAEMDSNEYLSLERFSIHFNELPIIEWKYTGNAVEDEANEIETMALLRNNYIIYPEFSIIIQSFIEDHKKEILHIINTIFFENNKYLPLREIEAKIREVEKIKDKPSSEADFLGKKTSFIELVMLMNYSYSIFYFIEKFYGLKEFPFENSLAPFISDLNSNLNEEFEIEAGLLITKNYFGQVKGYPGLISHLISSLFKNIEVHFGTNYQLIDSQRAIAKRYYSASDNDLLAQLLFSNKLKIDEANVLISTVLGIADEISIEEIDGYLKKVVIERNSTKINLADMGYGLTRLMPFILVSDPPITEYNFDFGKTQPIHIFKYNNWLMSEPEANLHPSLQSRLADLFVYLMEKSFSSFIIETHSEYLIRKLQYLVRQPDSPLKPEDVQIYYFYHPDEIPPGEQQIKPIQIDEEGNLTDNFGPGFYDESSRIAMDLWNMNASQKN